MYVLIRGYKTLNLACHPLTFILGVVVQVAEQDGSKRGREVDESHRGVRRRQVCHDVHDVLRVDAHSAAQRLDRRRLRRERQLELVS